MIFSDQAIKELKKVISESVTTAITQAAPVLADALG